MSLLLIFEDFPRHKGFRMNKQAPLAGLRVIESSILGPAAITTSFVDLGAEVIKVESPPATTSAK